MPKSKLSNWISINKQNRNKIEIEITCLYERARYKKDRINPIAIAQCHQSIIGLLVEIVWTIFNDNRFCLFEWRGFCKNIISKQQQINVVQLPGLWHMYQFLISSDFCISRLLLSLVLCRLFYFLFSFFKIFWYVYIFNNISSVLFLRTYSHARLHFSIQIESTLKLATHNDVIRMQTSWVREYGECI